MTKSSKKADCIVKCKCKLSSESVTSAEFKSLIENHLKHTLAREPGSATKRDWWLATCYALKDCVLARFIETQRAQHKEDVRRVYYLSLEYLMGRLLNNNLHNCGLFEVAQKALKELDLDYDEIREEEVDMGLGNGGLGRLAACFLDSLATLDYPAVGYGIHYEFGLFQQKFNKGRQEEYPDNWLRFGNPWQIVRPENYQEVHLYGNVQGEFNDKGDWKPRWVNTKTIIGVPWDIPIVGYETQTVNFLRLWESKASEGFDLKIFNEGGYVEAVREKAIGETISKVLYPNDKTENGKELRLVQQYFFVSCSLQDIIRRYKNKHKTWDAFVDKVAMQLNDTHPSIAIPELMRILMDIENMEWDFSWDICQKVFGYTNHTLLPEALEKWNVSLLSKVLPRHFQIICEINRRFLEETVEKRWPGDDGKKRELSIIEEGDTKMIRMAHLAVIGSHSTNGVAEIHTSLVKSQLFKNLFELFPDRFNNKTNGVTPRRWLKAANPLLADLISKKIGNEWPAKLDLLKNLAKFADDSSFQKEFMKVKHENKKNLAKIIKNLCNVEVSPNAIFDVQIKRIHEYKRQHLNLLHILTLYRRLLHNPNLDINPRVFIFAGKAAPGYELAKDIIYAINLVGEKINNDERILGKLKVVFLPNYSVSLATRIIPASDVSEQISTAGKEASGTGNMKLALNGSCTIGTLDGANVEMLEEIGKDNIFIFGKTVEEIDELRSFGYSPLSYYSENEELRNVLDWMISGFFACDGHDPVRTISKTILEHGDPFFLLADYDSYCKMQEKVDSHYKNRSAWAKSAILNVARMGKFSSDRTIKEYAEDIWKIKPVKMSF